jgi:hypothetical protein
LKKSTLNLPKEFQYLNLKFTLPNYRKSFDLTRTCQVAPPFFSKIFKEKDRFSSKTRRGSVRIITYHVNFSLNLYKFLIACRWILTVSFCFSRSLSHDHWVSKLSKVVFSSVLQLNYFKLYLSFEINCQIIVLHDDLEFIWSN